MEPMEPLVIFVMGRTTYTDMRRMEALVAASGLDVTIVRPSGLFDADAVSDYRVELHDHGPGRPHLGRSAASARLLPCRGAELGHEHG
ncbi:SDR family oxidoreductase [Herbiconiux sp. CPCC 205763]|uniref:SDR family oxidoreductase n=1 Tax=Herbiconiux aconitum TaxID=2970913 RepID=A0ABT2GV39_9MICO|nr:SDR family oxidoreductase [Herbiconiux aconitum]MCS5720006.1 SDR family oxidoreductase [Herbiconiux aconitum]